MRSPNGGASGLKSNGRPAETHPIRRLPSTRLRSLAATLAACAALLLAAAPASAIIAGQPDYNTHPYVGTLVAYYPGYGLVPYCSGTLVSATSFVTAAHCVTDLPPGVSLRGLSFAPSPFEDRELASHLVPIGGIHWHPAFQPGDMFFDVAVIDLASPVAGPYGALPALGSLEPLQSAKGPASVDFTIVGYGWEQFLPHSSGLGVRLVATSRLLDIEYSTKRQPGNLAVSSALKLTNEPALGGGICYSDSGGPHFASSTTNVVAAISVAGTMNCTGIHYALRLDTLPVLGFLAQYVK